MRIVIAIFFVMLSGLLFAQQPDTLFRATANIYNYSASPFAGAEYRIFLSVNDLRGEPDISEIKAMDVVVDGNCTFWSVKNVHVGGFGASGNVVLDVASLSGSQLPSIGFSGAITRYGANNLLGIVQEAPARVNTCITWYNTTVVLGSPTVSVIATLADTTTANPNPVQGDVIIKQDTAFVGWYTGDAWRIVYVTTSSGGGGAVSWNDLVDVPPGFADGIDNGILEVISDNTLMGAGIAGDPLKIDTTKSATRLWVQDQLDALPPSGVLSVLAGYGINIDATDASNPTVSADTTELATPYDLSLLSSNLNGAIQDTAANIRADFPLVPTVVSAFTNDAGYLTTEIDGSVSNEGALTAIAGTPLESFSIRSNTAGSTDLTFFLGDNLSGIPLTANSVALYADDDQTATEVPATPFSGVTGTNVQAQLQEIQGNIPTVPTAVSAFTNDAGYLTSEADGDPTNELQTLSTTGAAGNISLSDGGGTLNLNVNDADASTTNEGLLSVSAAGANAAKINSNTAGSPSPVIKGGANSLISISGDTIIVASTGGGGGGGTLESVTANAPATVNNTNPANPIVGVDTTTESTGLATRGYSDAGDNTLLELINKQKSDLFISGKNKLLVIEEGQSNASGGDFVANFNALEQAVNPNILVRSWSSANPSLQMPLDPLGIKNHYLPSSVNQNFYAGAILPFGVIVDTTDLFVKPVYYANLGYSGSAITEFLQQDAQYILRRRHIVSAIEQAITDIEDDQKLSIVHFWTQGEAESSDAATAIPYYNYLKELIEDRRKIFGREVHTIASLLSLDRPAVEIVNQAFRDLAAEDPYFHVVATEGFPFHDGTHYTAEGYRMLAQARIEKMREIGLLTEYKEPVASNFASLNKYTNVEFTENEDWTAYRGVMVAEPVPGESNIIGLTFARDSLIRASQYENAFFFTRYNVPFRKKDISVEFSFKFQTGGDQLGIILRSSLLSSTSAPTGYELRIRSNTSNSSVISNNYGRFISVNLGNLSFAQNVKHKIRVSVSTQNGAEYLKMESFDQNTKKWVQRFIHAFPDSVGGVNKKSKAGSVFFQMLPNEDKLLHIWDVKINSSEYEEPQLLETATLLSAEKALKLTSKTQAQLEMYRDGIPETDGFLKFQNITAASGAYGALIIMKATIGRSNYLITDTDGNNNSPAMTFSARTNNGLYAGNRLFEVHNFTTPVFSVNKTGVAILGANPQYALEVMGTNAVKFPVGTTAQRPTGIRGLLRGNSTWGGLDFHDGADWRRAAYYTDATPFNGSILAYDAVAGAFVPAAFSAGATEAIDLASLPFPGVAATNAQDALEEVQGNIPSNISDLNNDQGLILNHTLAQNLYVGSNRIESTSASPEAGIRVSNQSILFDSQEGASLRSWTIINGYMGIPSLGADPGSSGIFRRTRSSDNRTRDALWFRGNTYYPQGDPAPGTLTTARILTTQDLGAGNAIDADLLDGEQGSYYYSPANPPPAGAGDNLGNHTATQDIILGTNAISKSGATVGKIKLTDEGVRLESSISSFLHPLTYEYAALGFTSKIGGTIDPAAPVGSITRLSTTSAKPDGRLIDRLFYRGHIDTVGSSNPTQTVDGYLLTSQDLYHDTKKLTADVSFTSDEATTLTALNLSLGAGTYKVEYLITSKVAGASSTIEPRFAFSTTGMEASSGSYVSAIGSDALAAASNWGTLTLPAYGNNTIRQTKFEGIITITTSGTVSLTVDSATTPLDTFTFYKNSYVRWEKI